MSPAPSEDLIDRLGAAALDARAAVREAHEARKDLRRATAEAKAQILEDVSNAIGDGVAEIIARTNTKEIGDGLKRALDNWLALLDDAADVLAALDRKARKVEADAAVRAAGFVPVDLDAIVDDLRTTPPNPEGTA